MAPRGFCSAALRRAPRAARNVRPPRILLIPTKPTHRYPTRASSRTAAQCVPRRGHSPYFPSFIHLFSSFFFFACSPPSRLCAPPLQRAALQQAVDARDSRASHATCLGRGARRAAGPQPSCLAAVAAIRSSWVRAGVLRLWRQPRARTRLCLRTAAARPAASLTRRCARRPDFQPQVH